MWALVARALLAGAMIAAISEIGRRLPATAAIVASLPLVSVLGMVFLWHQKPDAENPLNLDGCADDVMREVVLKLWLFLLRPLRNLCVLCVRLPVFGFHSSHSSTSSDARSSARALASVSFHSSSATESATTPAAAWT